MTNRYQMDWERDRYSAFRELRACEEEVDRLVEMARTVSNAYAPEFPYDALVVAQAAERAARERLEALR